MGTTADKLAYLPVSYTHLEVEDIGSSFRDAERDAGRAARGIEDDLKDLKDSVDDVSNAISLGFGADMLVDLAGGMMDLMESTDELRGDLSMLDQNARAAGVGLGTTREAMKKLNTVSGETDSSIEAVSNLSLIHIYHVRGGGSADECGNWR